MNLYVLFGTECFFQWKCWFFWLQAFWKTVLLPFFHMNLYVFLRQNCIFQESVWFFGFRHFARRFCCLFSYECIRVLETELFFQWACSVCFCSGRYLFFQFLGGRKNKYIEYCLPTRPPQILIKKVLKNWFLQLLARSCFWRKLFSIQIPIEKVLKNWFFQLLARSWFWRLLLSIQILFFSSIEKLRFSFWQDLGFGECFFLFKFLLNNWFFSAFGKILVLANAFFYSNSN